MSYKNIYSVLGIEEEILRLEKQAKLGWEKEFRTLRWMGLNDNMNILDIGGGPGFFSELLLENLPNIKITIVDIDEQMMKFGKESLSNYNDRIQFVKSSITDIKLDNDKYDFAICRFVYQHINDPIRATKEIYRVLKKGGILTIIDNDKSMAGVWEPEIIKNNKTLLDKLEKKTKWNREVGRYLLKFIKEAGFKNIDFEAVTIHSDIVGIQSLMGNSKKNEDLINKIINNNEKLAKVIRERDKIINSKEMIIIMINLIAKGQK